MENLIWQYRVGQIDISLTGNVGLPQPLHQAPILLLQLLGIRFLDAEKRGEDQCQPWHCKMLGVQRGEGDNAALLRMQHPPNSISILNYSETSF